MLYSFGTLFWRDLGFGGVEIGVFWATAVACEIVLFQWSGPLMRRLGPLGFLALGGVAAIVRWLLFPLELGLRRLRGCCRGLHAFTFGAVYIGNQHAIARAVPEELTASAQGIFAMVVGLFMAIGTLVAGPLYENLGGNGFLVMAILPALALVVLAFYRRGLRSSAGT